MAEAADHIRYLTDPGQLSLRQPIAIVGLGGWIDAGTAGTGAVRHLMASMDAQRFAEIDPEEYFSFTDTRPLSRMAGPGERTIRWLRGQFRYIKLPETSPNDLVLYVSPEPNLRWRTYSRLMLDVFERVNVRSFVGLGAILGMVHHKAPVAINGWATTPELRAAMQRLNVGFSNYEGPTGFLTALMVEAQNRGLPAASLTGISPSYIQGVPNPRVSYALLRSTSQLMGLNLDLTDLERAGRALSRQVDRLLSDQPELREQVERMLSQVQEEEAEEAEEEARSNPDLPPPGASGDLPSPQAVVRELEDFLRELRGGDPGPGPSPTSD